MPGTDQVSSHTWYENGRIVRQQQYVNGELFQETLYTYVPVQP